MPSQDDLPDPQPVAPEPDQALPDGADLVKALQEAREAQAQAEKARQEAEAKAQENWDLFLRARADLDNYRKRMERDLATLVQRGKRDLLFSLLDVLDNFERALAAAGKAARQDEASEASPSESSLLDGFRIIFRQIEGVLARHGVERMQVVGQPFDPSRHEAVAVWDVPGLEAEKVTDEVRAGYTIDGEVLRAAQVRVGRPAPPSDPPSSQ